MKSNPYFMRKTAKKYIPDQLRTPTQNCYRVINIIKINIQNSSTEINNHSDVAFSENKNIIELPDNNFLTAARPNRIAGLLKKVYDR